MKKPAWRTLVIVLAALAPFVPMLVRGEVPSFRDHRDYFVPLREATASALRAGELPLWNPLSASGEPWLANPQTGVFYPPAWLTVVLPFETGYVLFLAFHLAIAGAGWRRLMLRWTGDDLATLSACALVVSGPMLSLLDVSNFLSSFAWIPLVLALALEGRAAGVAASAAAIAMSFLGGEPLVAFAGALLYAAIRLLRERRGALLPVSAVAAMSLLLTAVQLFPFLESLRGSDRALGLAPEAALAQSLSPLDWLQLPLAPMLPGSRSLLVTSQGFLLSLFVSPLLLLPALATLVLWRTESFPRRACAGWAGLFAVAAFLAAGSHVALAGRAYLALGLAASRYPAKFAPFGALALLALGTICAGAMLAGRRSARAGMIGVAAAALLAIAVAPSGAGGSIAHLGLWVAGSAVFFLVRLPRSAAVAIAIVLVAGDSIAVSRFLLASKVLPEAVAPHDLLLRRESKVVRLEQLDRRVPGAAARASREAWLGGYLNLRNGQADAMTAAPVVDERYSRLVDYAISRPRIDILDVLGAGYLLTTRAIEAPGYRLLGESDGVKVYERAAALPPVTVWERYEPAADRDAALASLMSETWSATERIAVTGSAPPPRSDAKPGAVSAGRVLGTTWRALRVEVDSPRGGIAVVGQRAAPGWSVEVDGVAAAPLVVDGILRGVAVSPGRHVVEWRYAPRSLGAGALLSVTGITLAGITTFRRRRGHSS